MIKLACANLEQNALSRYMTPWKTRDFTAIDQTFIAVPPIWLVLSEPH